MVYSTALAEMNPKLLRTRPASVLTSGLHNQSQVRQLLTMFDNSVGANSVALPAQLFAPFCLF